MKTHETSRREFLTQSGALAITAATAIPTIASSNDAAEHLPSGRAEACIFIWLGGGACHIDTWDPKQKGDGGKKPGSYYDRVSSAIPGHHVGLVCHPMVCIDRSPKIRVSPGHDARIDMIEDFVTGP